MGAVDGVDGVEEDVGGVGGLDDCCTGGGGKDEKWEQGGGEWQGGESGHLGCAAAALAGVTGPTGGSRSRPVCTPHSHSPDADGTDWSLFLFCFVILLKKINLAI